MFVCVKCVFWGFFSYFASFLLFSFPCLVVSDVLFNFRFLRFFVVIVVYSFLLSQRGRDRFFFSFFYDFATFAYSLSYPPSPVFFCPLLLHLPVVQFYSFIPFLIIQYYLLLTSVFYILPFTPPLSRTCTHPHGLKYTPPLPLTASSLAIQSFNFYFPSLNFYSQEFLPLPSSPSTLLFPFVLPFLEYPDSLITILATVVRPFFFY